MAFSPEEIERYARHIVLADVGGPGQQKLKAARVLIIGAGGLGSPALLYLAAAGVGTIGLVDDDEVSLSNLQRQVAHGTPDIGRLKVESASEAAARINPHVVVEAHAVRLNAQNARDLLASYDLVLDGSDNFETRYLVADTCEAVGRPLISGWLGQFDAGLTTLRPHETGEDGRRHPSYRCLFNEAPPPGSVPTCAEAGIIGALAGMVGSMMALEAVREITGFGQGLVRTLLLIDARSMRFERIAYERAT
jgi:adenylyltransferase/sulfurtransferase